MARTERSTRRRFLAGAAGVAVVGTAGAAAKTTGGTSTNPSDYPIPGALYPDRDLPWGDPYKQPIIGHLGRVTPGQIEVTRGGTSRLVAVSPTVSVYTDGAATLRDFLPHELVAVEGVTRGGAFEATAVWSAVTTITTQVRGVNGNVVDTSNGRIVLTPRTRFQHADQPAVPLRSGMEIEVEVRTAPGRDPIAAAIKVL